MLAQLTAEQPDNVQYQVLRLADGVSFVHVSTADTPDGSNLIPELESFKAFGKDIAFRVTAQPDLKVADVIASYLPR